MRKAEPRDTIGRRLACLDYFLITDIDNTLIGDDDSRLADLIELLEKHRDKVGFGVATGRRVDSAVEILRKHHLPAPDVIISSVGSEIHYGPKLHPGHGWEAHIAGKWNRKQIVKLLSGFDFLEYQDEAAQRPYKVSYNMTPGKDRLAKIHNRLLSKKCRYTLIYSHGKYLDILPFRASKGKAIRYVSYKWEIPLANFLVCGDSGNDEEMLRGEPMAVVVGNYSSEISSLKGARRVYFAKAECAGGIIEGMEKYRFLEKADRKNDCGNGS
jgi:sucrose-phosphate synthase